MRQHRFLDAAAACKKALRKPQDFVAAKQRLADCYYNQGVLDLTHSGLIDDAEKHFRLALEHDPRHVDALNNLAGLYGLQQRFADAVTLYRQALAIDAKQAPVLRDLAVTLQRLDRIDEASVVLGELTELMPEDGSAQLRDASLVASIIADAQYPALARRRMTERLAEFMQSGKPIADPTWLPPSYFYLSYHGLPNKMLNSALAAALLKACPTLGWQAPQVEQRRAVYRERAAGATQRIRIGLASAYLFNHSIGHTTRGLVEQLDRDKFEVIVIRLGAGRQDAISVAIDTAADRVVTTADTRELQQVRQRIAELELDVLFWQDIGMEPISYLLAFARLAPVQLTSYGHPDTTGIPNMDFFLSSDLYEPDGSAEHYSERLVCLAGAGTLAYYHRPEPPAGPPRRASFGLRDDTHVYLCPQTLFKVHPDMDDALAQIVQLDSRACIVFIDAAQGTMRERLQLRLEQRSAALAQRTVFVPRQSHADYLRLLQCADVILDTLHFNGQNTSLEGLALGVPIVTLPGAFHRGRHTYGMYQAMGFEALIAADVGDYAAKAVRMATDAQFRQRCVDEIERRAGVLYQNERFVRDCEDAIERMMKMQSRAG